MTKRILVVDDEELLLDLYEKNLENFGYVVDRASSGNQAVEKLTEQDYDLVLSDIRMPDGDGKTVLTFVRGELSSDIPVILLTGFSNGTCRELMGLGADTILFKPISIQHLVNTIQIYLPDCSSTRSA